MTSPQADLGSSALSPREDVQPPPRSRWRFIVPGTRIRLGIGALGLVALVVALLLLSVIVFPNWIVTEPKGIGQLTGTDRVTAENALDQTRNAVRGTLVQAIGGALVLLTFAVAFGQLMTARRGQLIDRFTKTVDQIGSDKIDVRLGGIYALQQIATNREYARPIAEIYAAFLKTHAAVAGDDRSCRPRLLARPRGVPPSAGEPEQGAPPPDLQAVLRILVLERLWSEATPDRLDLSRISVSRAELPHAQLTNCILLQASLVHANLQGADLSYSDLRKINLNHAQLRYAKLRADLSGATLIDAKLDDAILDKALLHEADLRDAKISTTHLWRTDFTKGDLRKAEFNGARLEETIFTDAKLGEAIFSGATLVRVNLIRANLTGADFSDAKLTEVILTDANLSGARGFESAVLDDATRSQVDDLMSRGKDPRSRRRFRRAAPTRPRPRRHPGPHGA